MKKRILLFTSSLLILSATMMSYNIGPARMFGENRTGADGGTANCSSGSGCHSGGNYVATAPTIKFYEGVDEVATWLPGHTYTVVAQSPTSALSCGFQVSASYNDGSYHPAGVFDATNPNTHDTIINGYSIVEHNNTLALQTSNFLMSMKWTAPANIITDTLYFYCTLNMVNGDATSTGDNSFNFKQKMGCATASVAQLSAGIKINAFPNPMTDKLNISLENADEGSYTISVFDMHGEIVATQTANVNNSFSTSVNSSSWAAGMYHVQLKNGDAQRTIAVVKQ